MCDRCGGSQFGANFIFVIAVIGWSGFCSFLMWVPFLVYENGEQSDLTYSALNAIWSLFKRFTHEATTERIRRALAPAGSRLFVSKKIYPKGEVGCPTDKEA